MKPALTRTLIRYWPVACGLFLLALLPLTAGSGLIAMKIVAHLLMPAGLIWIVLGLWMLWPGLPKRRRTLVIGLWLLYTLAGSPYLGSALLYQLEEPFYGEEQPTSRLDALILLGGGTNLSPGGRPAVGLHGDRILRPVTLYHEGMIGTLVTTGRSITESGADRILSHETSLLWQGMGIPEVAIIELPKPRNTREELRDVAELLKQHTDWKHIGLCTSASHLPRALKEARSAGLDLLPVPCDFRSGGLALSPLWLVPQGRGFRDVQTALWEFMGRLM